jgi:hypothetical protein
MLEKNPNKRLTLKSLDKKLSELINHVLTYGNIRINQKLIPCFWTDSQNEKYDLFCINQKSNSMFDFIKKDPQKLENVNSVIRNFTKAVVSSDRSSLIDVLMNKQFSNEEISRIAQESETIIPKYEGDSELD